jgi:outer membrane protein assembly factor BamB
MRTSALPLILFSCICAPLVQADWPDFRGPAADGHTSATGLPLQWSETKNVVWKTAIHDLGHSTPVVWGDQAWVTTAKKDGTVLYAVGIDVATGEVVHDIPVFNVEDPQRIHPVNSYATPSPTIEEGRLFVHYGSAGTAGIDTASGKVLWRRTDLNCDHMQGPAASLVLFEDRVIVHLEGTDKQFIVALDKKTGETIWRYDRPEDLYAGQQGVYIKSYQTPVFIEENGKAQMLSNGALLVTAHEPETGKEIWRLRYRDDNPISRIVYNDELLFINSGGSPGRSELYAVRRGGVGDVTDTHVVWHMTEDVAHESSPVLVDDLLYTMSDNGTLICMEAATGEQVWSERLKSKYGASLLTTGDRIYLSNKKGKTTIIAPGREYKVLAENEIDGELWASPAVVDDSLLLRTKTHLYRIAESK